MSYPSFAERLAEVDLASCSLVPAWAAPEGVGALCTTRLGGVSAAPYDSLNLGLHVGDDPARVAENRGRLAALLPARPVFLDQVHGFERIRLTPETPDGTQADVCTADQPGVVCTIMVADCLPILLAASDGSRVAAAHAGWRGLAGQQGYGVVEAALRCFDEPASEKRVGDTREITAWLGPCIGPTAFEVGDEVREAFLAAQPQAMECFVAHRYGKWLADLPGLARLRLAAAGITQISGNDGGTEWCTVLNQSRFFSHRRDGLSGRMAACVWLK